MVSLKLSLIFYFYIKNTLRLYSKRKNVLTIWTKEYLGTHYYSTYFCDLKNSVEKEIYQRISYASHIDPGSLNHKGKWSNQYASKK